jgi:hypothetical protein
MCAPVGVNQEENEQRIPGHADQMAAFFAIDNPIQVIQAKGIIEHAGGQPERDPMVGNVRATSYARPIQRSLYIQYSSIYKKILGPRISSRDD